MLKTITKANTRILYRKKEKENKKVQGSVDHMMHCLPQAEIIPAHVIRIHSFEMVLNMGKSFLS